jgi:signal transduction histidine kinase/ActR/RegA family two-component response regulator
MVAGDGEEALNLVRAEHPDVVIADILMPLMDGYEFARRLRADPVVGRTPIIFHTAGYELDEARSLAEACGISCVLNKPAQRKELLHAIENVLQEANVPSPAPEETFYRAHRRLLTDKLSEKVTQLEAALAESRKKEIRLIQTVEETVKAERALEKTNEDLRQKNQEIQNFYHTVSHELKTPLTSAREFVSIVIDGLAGPLNETQLEYLRIAQESCNRLRVCIDDLMDATRLETGKLTLEMKPASLPGLIKQLVTLLGPVAKRRNVSLIKKVDPQLADFPFDENRIMQVLVNLVNNALKFTASGGQVVVSASESDDQAGDVKVSVKDTGCGIAATELERIFGRLYQVPNEDGSMGPGLGLGLYISRELIESHGGKIWVESEPGKGSNFCFVIPKEQAPETTHVLLIDDEARVRDLAKRALERQGFEVTTAENGVVALAKMKEKMPDLVITDLVMPKMDGTETLREIRRGWGLLPVIILTGFPENEHMKRAMDFSPFTLLAKPCPTEQLVQTIRSLVPRKGPHDQACGRKRFGDSAKRITRTSKRKI